MAVHNSCHYSYQRTWHLNEANGWFSIVLTHQPRLHAAVNKRSFACRPNWNRKRFKLNPRKNLRLVTSFEARPQAPNFLNVQRRTGEHACRPLAGKFCPSWGDRVTSPGNRFWKTSYYARAYSSMIVENITWFELRTQNGQAQDEQAMNLRLRFNLHGY